MSRTKPAGFWLRFVACVIDAIILSIITYGIGFILEVLGVVDGPVSPDNLKTLFDDPNSPNFMQNVVSQGAFNPWVFALQWFVSIVFTIFFVCVKGGGPGKLMLNLRVVGKNNKNLNPIQAFIREYPGKIISAALLGAGYIMAAFTENKRALHDYLGGSRVILEEDN